MKRIRTLSISPHSHTQITLASKCYPAIAGDKKNDCLELSRVGTRRMLHILRSCQHSKDAYTHQMTLGLYHSLGKDSTPLP